MSWIDEARATLETQMTPRLAYWLAALGVLAIAYLVVTLHNMRLEAATHLESAQRELAVVSQPDGLAIWEERASEAAAVRQAWEVRRWQGDTPGIASAEAQAALGAVLSRVGLEGVKLSVSSDPVNVGSDALLRYEIAGIGDSHVLIALLVELTTANQTYIITEVTAPLRERRKSRITVGGYLPYQSANLQTETAQ